MKARRNRVFKAIAAMTILAICVSLCPTSEAAVNRPFDISCSIVPQEMRAFGRAELGGTIAQGQMVVGISNMTMKSVASLTIYSESENRTYEYANAEILLEGGSSMLAFNQTLSVSGGLNGAIIYMEQNGTIVCALAGYDGNVNIRGGISNGILFPSGGSMTVSIPGTYSAPVVYNTSNNYYCSFSGNVDISEHASAIMLPAEGISIEFHPTEEPLDINEIIQMISEAVGAGGEDSGITGIPAIETFNGAIIGSLNGTVEVGGEVHQISGEVNIFRFESATFGLAGGMVHVQGQCKFAMFGGAVYDETRGIDISGFTLPAVAIYLWIGAAAALAISIFLKPIIVPIVKGLLGGKDASPQNKNAPKGGEEKQPPQKEQKQSKGKSDIASDLNDIIKLPSLIAHIALMILAFWLFDQEFKYILGVSLFESIGNLTSGINFTDLGSMLSLAFAIFVPISWALMTLLFGLPVKVIASSIFRFFGIAKGARGISKGIGSMVGTYIIGSTLILWSLSFILPLIFSLVLGGIGGGLPNMGG